jgi:hypothetical protein
MVAVNLDREQATRIATDWATRFYSTSELDIADVRSRSEPVNCWLVSLTQRSDPQTVYAVVLADGLVVEPVEDDTVPDEDLITLARIRFPNTFPVLRSKEKSKHLRRFSETFRTENRLISLLRMRPRPVPRM